MGKTRDQGPTTTGPEGTQGGLVQRTIQPEAYTPLKARTRKDRSPLLDDIAKNK